MQGGSLQSFPSLCCRCSVVWPASLEPSAYNMPFCGLSQCAVQMHKEAIVWDSSTNASMVHLSLLFSCFPSSLKQPALVLPQGTLIPVSIPSSSANPLGERHLSLTVLAESRLTNATCLALRVYNTVLNLARSHVNSSGSDISRNPTLKGNQGACVCWLCWTG